MAFERNEEKLKQIGKLSEKDRKALEGLIPIRDKVPESYEKLRQQEQEKIVNDKDIGGMELLINSIEWYSKYNKKSSIKIQGRKLDEELNKLNESQLFEINDIFSFCHEGFEDDDDQRIRFIVTDPDHDKMSHVLSKIKKLIPGFAQSVELKKLENQQSNIEKRKNELKKQIEKAKRDFKVKLVETKEEKSIMEEIKEIKPEIPKEPSIYICPYPECNGRDCHNPGGLAKHVKYSHELKEQQVQENAPQQ